ncbi:hypothetical protein MTX20_37510 [Bradyrhizobium sp. ISRA435]|nr:hypothetical protein MTX20_37510 [Bradyrhizobium sp. ISRA435]
MGRSQKFGSIKVCYVAAKADRNAPFSSRQPVLSGDLSGETTTIPLLTSRTNSPASLVCLEDSGTPVLDRGLDRFRQPTRSSIPKSPACKVINLIEITMHPIGLLDVCHADVVFYRYRLVHAHRGLRNLLIVRSSRSDPAGQLRKFSVRGDHRQFRITAHPP